TEISAPAKDGQCTADESESYTAASDGVSRSNIVKQSFWLAPRQELEFAGSNVRKVHIYNAKGSTVTVKVYKENSRGEESMIFSTSVSPGEKMTEKSSVGSNGSYRITVRNGNKKSDVYIHIERH
ncbi:MAG: hypothetical protein NXI22_25085, partial [bacterium]|nr:hypothetical protein [bacterium]